MLGLCFCCRFKMIFRIDSYVLGVAFVFLDDGPKGSGRLLGDRDHG